MAAPCSAPPRIQLSLIDANALDISYELAEGATLPAPAHPGEDVGADIRAYLPMGPVQLMPGDTRMIPAGYKIALPKLEPPFILDYQIRSRSGLASKHDIVVVNQPATIDPGYRGWIVVTLHRLEGAAPVPFMVEHGDRIAQAVLALAIDQSLLQPRIVERLEEDSQRGASGFGSTGHQ